MTLVHVAAHLTAEAEAFARRVCAAYTAGHKPRSRALAAPGVPVIWDKPDAQRVGRLGEIALALFFELDPRTALDWSDKADNGADLVVGGRRFDVKTSSHPHASLLIWPASKPFAPSADVLVAARLEDRDELGAEVRLQGWITAADFAREAHTWTRTARLAPGTRYVTVDELNPMRALRAATSFL